MQQPELDDRQRAEAARVTAILDRLDGDTGHDTLPAVKEASRDRVVLGDVLGDYLHRVTEGTQAETIRYWPALELLRAAGADGDRATAKAAWLRQRPPAD